MLKKRGNSVTGFTFVEIILAVSIFLVLIVSLYGVMETGRGSWFRASTAVELRQEIIRALTRMESELKEVRPGLISLAAGDTSSSLVFKLPQDIDNDGTILSVSLGQVEWSNNITYALNGANEITRTVQGDPAFIIAKDIVSLEFTRPVGQDRILEILITARKTSVLRNTVEDTGGIEVKMRN